MATIARRIEKDYPRRTMDSHLQSTIPNAISGAVSTIASQLNASAILPLTKSGATAHNVSKFRPAAPILAITSEVQVARKLQLVWGVTPLVVPQQKSTSGTFTVAMGAAQDMGLLKEGDLVIQTAGTLTGISGSTDLVKVGSSVPFWRAAESEMEPSAPAGETRSHPQGLQQDRTGGDPGDAGHDGRRSGCDPPRRRNRDGSPGRNISRGRDRAAPGNPHHFRSRQRHTRPSTW